MLLSPHPDPRSSSQASGRRPRRPARRRWQSGGGRAKLLNRGADLGDRTGLFGGAAGLLMRGRSDCEAAVESSLPSSICWIFFSSNFWFEWKDSASDLSPLCATKCAVLLDRAWRYRLACCQQWQRPAASQSSDQHYSAARLARSDLDFGAAQAARSRPNEMMKIRTPSPVLLNSPAAMIGIRYHHKHWPANSADQVDQQRNIPHGSCTETRWSLA